MPRRKPARRNAIVRTASKSWKLAVEMNSRPIETHERAVRIKAAEIILRLELPDF
jgi:hypothetical protein